MSHPNALPKYVAIAEMLIREIAAGRLIDGERLAPEREMAEGLGISVGTLRKSLQELAKKGLLERRQGSGNYIRSNVDGAGIYAFFRLELKAGGGLPTAEVLDVTQATKPSDLPAFGTSTRAHRIRRLRRLSGVPAALEEIWLDGAAADVVKESDLSESLYLYYRTSLNLWIARAEDKVGVSVVPDWTVPGFDLAAGAGCGFVERVSWSQAGDAVEYSRTWFDADKVSYVARLK